MGFTNEEIKIQNWLPFLLSIKNKIKNSNSFEKNQLQFILDITYIRKSLCYKSRKILKYVYVYIYTYDV